jgi:hypothetical protein
MKKHRTDQIENILVQWVTSFVVLFAIILVVGLFTIIFWLLSFDMPKGKAHPYRKSLIQHYFPNK